MTETAVPMPTSCELDGHLWDLKYNAIALRHLQMRLGSLDAFVLRLTKEGMGVGLSLEVQALMIWAGQRSVEPGLKLGWVKRFLRTTDPRIRAILTTWAAADFCRAVLELASSQIEAAHPAPQDAEDEDGEEP